MDRGSASPGERASADWLAERLREEGADDVRKQSFDYQRSFAGAHGVHFTAGLLAACLGGRAGAVLAAATWISYDLEFAGSTQWVRRVLPSSEGTTVVARLPSRRERRRTVVLVAHHDTAKTGLMWHPRLVGWSVRNAARTGKVESFATAPQAALALGAAGSILCWRTPRIAAAAVLGTALALSIDLARGDAVPGANDNASGVAGVLALVRRFAGEPLEDTEVIALLPGCEESGMGGMAAWLREERSKLDPERTLVLGLDTLGCGEPIVLWGEGPALTVHYREEDLGLADRGADRAAVPRPRRFRIGGWTDPVLALRAQLHAISILSVKDGGFTNYHLPTDTPDRVDWDSVERCIRIAAGVAEEWASGAA